MLNIVIFGPPGAGKGTQSDFLVSKYSLVHISTGDLLRNEIKAQTDLGKQAQLLINDGHFVSDEVVVGMISNKISEHKNAKGFIFDGFPRTNFQAKALDELLPLHKMELSCVLSLEVENNELITRILKRGKISGRADDQSKEIIMTRIQEYNLKTAPIKDFYKIQGKLNEISGIGTIDEIFADIETICDTFVKK